MATIRASTGVLGVLAGAVERHRHALADAAVVLTLAGVAIAYDRYYLGLLPGTHLNYWPGIGPVFDTQQHAHVLITAWWAATAIETAALLVRRRLPLTAFAAAVLAAGWHLADTWFPTSPIDLAAAVTLYTALLATATRRAWVGLIGVGLLVPVMITIAGEHFLQGDYQGWEAPLRYAPNPATTGPLNMTLLAAFVLAPAWMAAHTRHSERQAAALATAAQRADFHRELHDVIGHHLSVIVIQTQAAAGVLDHAPHLAHDSLAQVVTLGQECLTHLRALLRASTSTGEFLQPPSGLSQLPELVERVRHAGIPTAVNTDPDLPALPTLVDLSAYRIIQEALTNTIRHAGSNATATITIDYHDDAVHIDITDTGIRPPPTGASHTPGPAYEPYGNGLPGIRERAAALGGITDIGPQPNGGFRVRAALPLPPKP